MAAAPQDDEYYFVGRIVRKTSNGKSVSGWVRHYSTVEADHRAGSFRRSYVVQWDSGSNKPQLEVLTELQVKEIATKSFKKGAGIAECRKLEDLRTELPGSAPDTRKRSAAAVRAAEGSASQAAGKKAKAVPAAKPAAKAAAKPAAKAAAKAPAKAIAKDTPGAAATKSRARGSAANEDKKVTSPRATSSKGQHLVKLPEGRTYPRELIISPGDVPLHDYMNKTFDEEQEFEIQHILDERAAGKDKEYLVKWKGFELNPEEWTEAANLRGTTALKAWQAQKGQ